MFIMLNKGDKKAIYLIIPFIIFMILCYYSACVSNNPKIADSSIEA